MKPLVLNWKLTQEDNHVKFSFAIHIRIFCPLKAPELSTIPFIRLRITRKSFTEASGHIKSLALIVRPLLLVASNLLDVNCHHSRRTLPSFALITRVWPTTWISSPSHDLTGLIGSAIVQLIYLVLYLCSSSSPDDLTIHNGLVVLLQSWQRNFQQEENNVLLLQNSIAPHRDKCTGQLLSRWSSVRQELPSVASKWVINWKAIDRDRSLSGVIGHSCSLLHNSGMIII